MPYPTAHNVTRCLSICWLLLAFTLSVNLMALGCVHTPCQRLLTWWRFQRGPYQVLIHSIRSSANIAPNGIPTCIPVRSDLVSVIRLVHVVPRVQGIARFVARQLATRFKQDSDYMTCHPKLSTTWHPTGVEAISHP